MNASLARSLALAIEAPSATIRICFSSCEEMYLKKERRKKKIHQLNTNHNKI